MVAACENLLRLVTVASEKSQTQVGVHVLLRPVIVCRKSWSTHEEPVVMSHY